MHHPTTPQTLLVEEKRSFDMQRKGKRKGKGKGEKRGERSFTESNTQKALLVGSFEGKKILKPLAGLEPATLRLKA
jgi:hypothetical protein